jgi:protocatechuate 3,4-dioxygenase beta subunit
MTLALRVVDQTCTPIAGAIVDAWGCDAEGWYSGHNVNPDVPLNLSGPARGATRVPDMPERFLRGVLATDADGIAEFDMIYPGYYIGRAIHTHYKVHIGEQVFLTSQALYPEDFNEKVMGMAPYNAPRDHARVLNADDNPIIGDAGLITVVERGERLLSLITLTVQT